MFVHGIKKKILQKFYRGADAMYEYKWIGKDNLFELSLKETKLQMELRPVFTDEIRNLSLDKFIQFEGDTDVPVLWAEGIRHYIVSAQ